MCVRRSTPSSAVVVFSISLLCVLGSRFAGAHVMLDSPNGNETLIAGSVFTIEYNPSEAHGDTINYELSYSLTGEPDSWVMIDDSIPVDPDNNVSGRAHFYAWTVPDSPTDTAFVRIFQNNPGEILNENDWDDVSDAAFRIVLPSSDFSGNGTVDLQDYTVWRDRLGDEDESQINGGDGGGVTESDYMLWQSSYGETVAGASLQTAPVPEPSAWVLILVGGAILGARWRRCVC